MITEAATFNVHGKRIGSASGFRHVIDCAAEGIGTVIKRIGTAQYFGVFQSQWFEQFIRRAARSTDRQAVKHEISTGAEGVTAATVDSGTTDRNLDAVTAARRCLCKHARLIGQDVLRSTYTASFRILAADEIGRTRYFIQLQFGLGLARQCLALDDHRVFDLRCRFLCIDGTAGHA
ncbi:hypothetical protein D3C72_479350 [compost metagenome]